MLDPFAIVKYFAVLLRVMVPLMTRLLGRRLFLGLCGASTLFTVILIAYDSRG